MLVVPLRWFNPVTTSFMVWGDKIDQFQIAEGQELTVHVDLESREYNGRWYTDVKAWRVDRSEAGDRPPAEDSPPPPPNDAPPADFDDDIPF